jgi:hypothetical protein
MSKAVLFVPALVVAGVVAAQNAEPPNAHDPKAKVPPVEHRSAFEGYQRYSEPEVSRWRERNDEVGRVGGHVGMHRQQGGASKPAPKPPAHGEHK